MIWKNPTPEKWMQLVFVALFLIEIICTVIHRLG
jgi:hypothetical protein